MPRIRSPFSTDDRRVGPDDDGLGIDLLDVVHDHGHVLRRGGVELVDDEDLGPAEVRLAGIVEHLVAGPVRVDDDDLQVGLVEGEVVVAAVPEDDVGFLLGLAEDGLVVDAGVDDRGRSRCRARTLRVPRWCIRACRGRRRSAKRWTFCLARSP